MSARNKIFFGGLPPDEAELAARFAYRGQLDLQKPKRLYDKPVVVDHRPEWLLSESRSQGTAHATGTTETYGEGEAILHSITESRGTSVSESETVSASEMASEAEGSSQGHTDFCDFVEQCEKGRCFGLGDRGCDWLFT